MILLAAPGLAQTAPPGAAPTASPIPKTSARGKAGKITYTDGFTLAFVDADARHVADAVLGSMLGLDYDVDPKVTGSITLRTAHAVTRDQLVPLLEAALRPVGAAIVISGGRYHVEPIDQARATAPVTVTGGTAVATPGYASEVVTLKAVSAPEMARLLTQFLGKDIVGGTNPGYNQVVIAGTGEERQAARAMIDRFDIDTLAGMNFTLYKLENVDPDSLIIDLQRIFQPPLDIIGTRVRLVPLPRLHGVLAIAADRSDLARVEPWIHRLDAGGSGSKRKLYSYTVQNGRARDLAASLQAVLGSLGVGGPQQSPAANSAPAFATTNGAGTFSQNDPSSGMGGGLGGASGGGGSMLQPASNEPSDVIASQTPLPGSTPIATLPVAAGEGGVRIVPSDDTNSLLIYANGEEYDLIRDALDKIDRPVPQVLIEATLAEVTLTNDLSAGVDWAFLTGHSAFSLSSTGAATPTSVFPGFSYSYIANTAKAVLNTLQSKTNVRVLSAPKLIVLNNQTATLQVGDEVPIVTAQSQSTIGTNAPIVNSVEMRDTGVILKVTPRVNDSGTVTLDIAQEVSDVVETTSSGINSPTIQQRRLASTIATRSGQMIALGGLIRDETTKGRSGIPFLSQIPVIGVAFGQQKVNKTRTELIILLTPTVMRSPEDARNVVDDLINGMDETAPLVAGARGAPIVYAPQHR